MSASQFVGRVGGLAVALGIGVGVFAGAGVAVAERGGASGDSGSTSADSATASSVSSTRRGAAAAVDAPDAPSAEPEAVAVEPQAEPEPLIHIDPVFEEPPAGELTEVFDEATEPATGGPDPIPVALEGPEAVAYADPGPAEELAPQPKTAVPLVATTTSAPAAKADSGPLTFAPVTAYYDGILQGNLNVTSASGCGTGSSECKLIYELVDTSNGGKANFGNVPKALDPLLPVGAKGGAGSFTFLPYATWIDPAKPTSFPTPTGTQTFTVRVSENTKFNQTVTSIPLIGALAAPIISLLQQLPLISSLLVPLIGASATTTVSVNVGGLTGGKQVAYTYVVDSFDGTPISMNYFPAAAPSLLPDLGNKQATIFNGPGLGGAGATNPYSTNETTGSVPGLALMRGQGLPGQLATAPLGFNVITWDPRGEWDSGGILQLDNPFFEGRDVSSLIDWANVNTPLLNEGGKPDVAMLGGSYGGMIQMTTVDPRIKAIVPSIAPHSALGSLYPNEVFKTAWANTLADALLFTGASSIDRINTQVTVALATGNLFGFIDAVGQAVIASSGPTALLKKLSIPTMYTQGTHDALFPLQEALDNARTQLEQNPFFAGAAANLVKMIWFCGGHGFCSPQTLQQQEQQATVMFLENMVWVNKYTKDYLAGIPAINGLLNGFLQAIAPFQWWDQKGTALASFVGMPYTKAFQNTPRIVATNATGGRINSFTSVSGPLTADDPAGVGCAVSQRLCQWPVKQVFATSADNAVEVAIPIASGPAYVVGAPTVSFTYRGSGNAKAVYAQIVDNESGQVLGNIVTPVPVILDGTERTVTDFPIANIAYTAPASAGKGLTLQIVGNASLYNNNAVIWNANISKVSVSLPTTGTAIANPVPGLIPK